MENEGGIENNAALIFLSYLNMMKSNLFKSTKILSMDLMKSIKHLSPVNEKKISSGAITLLDHISDDYISK